MSNTLSSRRRFLGTALAAGVASPLVIPRSVLAQPGQAGANDLIIVGFVSAGGRAQQLMSHIPKSRAKIVAIADFWRQKAVDAVNNKRREHAEHGGFDNIDQWNLYDSDLEMYEKEKLDCSFISTQDFTRTIAGCRAVMAGLDVYAEKALTTYIAEGRVLVNCVRKHNRIFQVGSQQRSMRLNRFGCALVREGKLGRVNLIQARNYYQSYPIPNNLPEEPIPAGLNWDAWQGPTAYRPFNGQLLGWMRWEEYNGGDMTNWGAHGVDQIQWAMGADDTGPVELYPLLRRRERGGEQNGQYVGRDGAVAAKYANGVEVRFELDPGPAGGAIFRCERGNLEINRNILRANPESLIADAPEPDPPEGPTWSAATHIEDFFDCVATRELPSADVEIGHRSITFCHLVGICRRLNRRLHWDPVSEQFIGDDEANALVDLPRRAGFELPVV